MTFKNFINKKFVKIPLIIIILLFAAEGFLLTATYVGMKFQLFKVEGAVDYNDRYFQNIEQVNRAAKTATDAAFIPRIATVYKNLYILNQFYPYNARNIEAAYTATKDVTLAEKMLQAIQLELIDNEQYTAAIEATSLQDLHVKADTNSAIAWMNIQEWQDFQVAVAKDTALINRVAAETRVEPRLIVAVLLGEQMRLFNSKREKYKQVIAPLKVLSVQSQFSLGVGGVKEFTAIRVEKNLKDTNSVYYLGKEYEHLLDFKTADTTQERIDRLVDYRNHYYSYLYMALIIRQIREQWRRAGYDISDRPEILATLYNVGFAQSVPKENPRVGGSKVNVNDKLYSFGSLSYQFYYSGEMMDLFPYRLNYW